MLRHALRFTAAGLVTCAIGCGTDSPPGGDGSGSGPISATGVTDTDGTSTTVAATDSGTTLGTGTQSGTDSDATDSSSGTSASGSESGSDTSGGESESSGSSSTGEDECAALNAEPDLVPLPADIVFVVDNSGSMTFEASEVQAKLNEFSTLIDMSGIDARVVLISSYPNDGNGICIDMPLGNGGCPNSDNNPPLFTHVDERVGSNEPWDAILARHGDYSGVLRDEASLHLVVVTDDEPSGTLAQFDGAFLALNPAYAGYFQHSVVSHSNCPTAADIGQPYIDLSMQTGGVATDLCDQDFDAVFDALTTAIVGGSALACEFAIPDPPMGEVLDPDLVNVEIDDGMGGVVQISRVDDAAACAGVADGWYYDDPVTPTTIIMCPQTCEDVQDQKDGGINIAFGCATILPG